jgi:cytochrome c
MQRCRLGLNQHLQVLRESGKNGAKIVMRQALFKKLKTDQKQLAVRLSVREHSGFLIGFSVSILMLLALIIFPRISHADTNVDRGKQLFEKRCTGCHSLDQDKEGPRLRGVYGRQSGTVPGFTYSAALQSSHLTWDDASLDKWLTDTDSLVAGNDMAFHVPKQDERADIIRFLKTMSVK